MPSLSSPCSMERFAGMNLRPHSPISVCSNSDIMLVLKTHLHRNKNTYSFNLPNFPLHKHFGVCFSWVASIACSVHIWNFHILFAYSTFCTFSHMLFIQTHTHTCPSLTSPTSFSSVCASFTNKLKMWK